MIKNEREKARKLQQMHDAENLIRQNRELLKRVGTLTEAEIEQHLAPTQSIFQQLKEEIDDYESLRQGKLPDGEPIQEIGAFLVKLRIFQGMTQKDLAKKINVDETQVSRDERNLYKGVSLERLLRVIEALNVRIQVKVTDTHSNHEDKQPACV